MGSHIMYHQKKEPNLQEKEYGSRAQTHWFFHILHYPEIASLIEYQ